MNEAAKMYWNQFWESQNVEQPNRVSAWKFGTDPDYLAQLVIDGVKTATCSGLIFYEIENEPLPTIGEYSVILNSTDEPLAIIKNVEVKMVPMNEVPFELAFAEGEGDQSYQYWKESHEKFFKKELSELGLKYKEDMMLVFERFELVDVK